MKKFTLSMLGMLLCWLSAAAMPADEIIISSVTPKAGTIDLEMRSLQQINITFSEEVELGPKAKVTMLCPDGKSIEGTMTINKYRKNSALINFAGMKEYTGKYEMTIKRWSVGDEEWLKNPESGRSNPALTVEWEAINGLDPGSAYNLEPLNIQPADNASFEYSNGGAMLRQVQITLPGGTLRNSDIDIVLDCSEARYSRALTFVGTPKGNNMLFTAMVSPPPTVSGTYTLIIPGGAFYIPAEGENERNANAPKTLQYVISGAQSEDGEMLDIGYYDLTPAESALTSEGDKHLLTLDWAKLPVTDAAAGKAQLLAPDGIPVEGIEFTFANGEGSATTVSFEAELAEDTVYTLLIPEGIYTDEEWAGSKGATGSANPQLTFTLEKINAPTPPPASVDDVMQESDKPQCVYTATGIMLYRDATEAQIQSLAPGFYIIGGKKVIVK